MTIPQPLKNWPSPARRHISGVFSDIDDTMTTGGHLHGAVVDAIERLRAIGILFVPITGRPAGWCDMIARMLPVDGVVGENGAFYFRYDAAARRMVRRHLVDEKDRANNRQRLDAIRAEVLKQVPGAAVAADQGYRECDLAIDFAEDTGPLPPDSIDQIVEIFTRHGARAKVSSIHVNGWFGDYDKLAATKLLMKEQFSVDLEAGREDFVFVGDSPNDAPMFDYFPHSVGVANLNNLQDRCEALPQWITTGERGQGFVELVDALLAVR
jgi:HAD superfamily hydrolase (TIGR01484 family)